MFVWLHLTLVKVAGANWRTSSTAAYSHLVRPGSCFLDIFAGFNILLPRLLSEMQGQNSCIKDHADRRVCFFLLQSFGHAAEQHPSIPMEHFLDISCSLFTPLVLDSPGFFFFLASSPVGCIDLSNEESRSLLAAQHPAEKGAGFDFRWSKKPLTSVTHHSVEVKMMQLCKNSNVTTDKM